LGKKSYLPGRKIYLSQNWTPLFSSPVTELIQVIILFVRVTVTGIYRATPMRVNPRQRNVKAVYKTYIDVIHFKKTDKKRLYSKDPDG